MNSNKLQKYLKWVIGSASILPLFFMIQTTDIQTVSAVGTHKTFKINALKAETNVKEVSKKEISHNQIVSLTHGFMDILVQEIDNNNKVVNFNNKKSLLDEFEKVTTKDVAAEFVDFYFLEKPDGLYIIPTETPPWFDEKNDYDMIQVEEDIVKVVQDNKSDLYGSYTVKIEFTYNSSQWKITNIQY